MQLAHQKGLQRALGQHLQISLPHQYLHYKRWCGGEGFFRVRRGRLCRCGVYQSRPSRELAVPQYFLYHNGTVLCEHWAHVFAPPQAEKGSRGRGKDIGVRRGMRWCTVVAERREWRGRDWGRDEWACRWDQPFLLQKAHGWHGHVHAQPSSNIGMSNRKMWKTWGLRPTTLRKLAQVHVWLRTEFIIKYRWSGACIGSTFYKYT